MTTFKRTNYQAEIDTDNKTVIITVGGKPCLTLKFGNTGTFDVNDKIHSLSINDSEFKFKDGSIEVIIRGKGQETNFPADITGDFRDLFNWAPPFFETVAPETIPVLFRLGSRYPKLEGKNDFDCHGGIYAIPPYLMAFSTSSGCVFGIGQMEIPQSHYVLSGKYLQNSLNVGFGYLPVSTMRLGMFFGAAPDEIIGQYCNSIKVPAKKYSLPRWWNEPWYDSYYDQLFELMQTEGESKSEYKAKEKCAGKLLLRIAGAIEKNDLQTKTIVIGTGWSRFLGDIEIKPDVGKAISVLKRKGYRILLAFFPYLADEDSEVYKNHPDYFVYEPGPKRIVKANFPEHNREYVLFDYTNSEVRAYVRNNLVRLIKEYGIDGLKVERTSYLPKPDAIFADPAWGMGEVMQHKTLELIYDTVKQCKKDSLVILPSSNPFFNDVCDVHSLGHRYYYDESPDDYGNRAEAALKFGNRPLYIDDASAFSSHIGPHLLEKCTYGVPSLGAVLRRSVTKIKSDSFSTGYPIPLTKGQANLVNAAYTVYNHSVLQKDDQIYCSSEDKIFHRKRGNFYSAATVSGTQVLVTYAKNKALLCAAVGTKAVIPIPPGKKPVSLRKIMRNGKTCEAQYYPISGNKILAPLESSKGDVKHYVLNYK